MHKWSISDLALARPVTVSMTLCALFLLGIIAAFKLPLAFMPATSVSRVGVRFNVERASPEILEREVIRPVEEQIAGIRDLKTMRTNSGSWGVYVNLEFQPGTDIDSRKIELRERMERARVILPDIVEDYHIDSSRNDEESPAMRLQIASERDLSQDYYLILKEVVRPLERVRGVARVEISGVEAPELEFAIDPIAAQRNGVSVREIAQTIRQAGQGKSLGLVRQSASQVGLRSPSTHADVEAYASLPLRRDQASTSIAGATPTTDSANSAEVTPTDSRSLSRLSEVAAVKLHPQEQRRIARLNGKPAVNVEIFAASGTSAVELSKSIREKTADMQNNHALEGIEVRVFQDQGELIVNTLGDLRNTGIFGGLIGVIVLFIFLHRMRPTLAAAVCIPLSVLMACGTLMLRGGEINCMVLLGLVLGVGMLIDNAVVIVESIQLQLQKGLPPAHAALQGAREVSLATIASTLSSIIVFLPLILGKPGEMSDLLRPLGATFVTALLCSLLVSQSIVPMLLGRRRQAAFRPSQHRILDRMADYYGRLISLTLRRPIVAVLIAAVICASAYLPATSMNVDLNRVEEQSLGVPIQMELSGSTDITRVQMHTKVLEDAILPRREELGFESLACSLRDWRGSCEVFPAQAIESEQEQSDFKARLEAALPPQVGLTYRVGVQDFWRFQNRDPREVSFALRGEDMTTLNKLSEKVAAHLRSKIPKADPANPDAGGYERISGPFNEGAQELHIILDSERLLRNGLRPNDVAEQIAFSYQGSSLGRARGPDGEVELRMTGGDIDPNNQRIDDLRSLKIRVASGQEIPLSSVANIELARTPYWVQRIDRKTELGMQVRFVEPDMQKNQELVERAMADFVFPPGYDRGERFAWWMQGEESNEMLINLGLCLLLVYAVMASLFESYAQPAGILITGLLGCIGAPWAMWLTGTTVDLVALIGMFILIGIVVNNGIMLVDKVTQFRQVGMPRKEALRQAGQDRLRPILMTVATSIVGLTPMLIHHPTVAGVYYHGIAIVVAGGLLTSTIFTLLFLPAIYSLIEDLALAVRAHWARALGKNEGRTH